MAGASLQLLAVLVDFLTYRRITDKEQLYSLITLSTIILVICIFWLKNYLQAKKEDDDSFFAAFGVESYVMEIEQVEDCFWFNNLTIGSKKVIKVCQLKRAVLYKHSILILENKKHAVLGIVPVNKDTLNMFDKYIKW